MRRTRTLRSWPLAVCLALLGAATEARAEDATSPKAAAGNAAAGDAERAARWHAIAGQIFGDRKLEPTDSLIRLDAPLRADDAALVPITLTMPEKDKIKAVYLVIDDNPAPLAARFTFGPAADTGSLQMRVRIDAYTNVHAVAETHDGGLFVTEAFVKASGGCAAPAGESDEVAMQGIGEMRLRLAGAATAAAGKPVAATLMIRHPNFNGMQMNQLTRTYTPPRYIDKVSVTYGAAKVLDLETDISLSSNPVITFSFVPNGDGKEPVRVVASDTKSSRWEQSFEVPPATN